MKNRFLFSLGILVAVILAVLAITGWYRNAGFTPWMSHADLDQFLSQYDSTPPGGHPNYWDKGHWINAVEGRWHNGIPEYRIRYGTVPPHRARWWYWYLNQDQESYSRHVHELADQGFTLLDPNSFLRPDGTRRYQGVWQKLIPPDGGKPAQIAPTPELPHLSTLPNRSPATNDFWSGLLGIVISDDETGSPGVKIARILPGSSAEKADLKAGDRLMSVDGQSIEGLSIPQVVRLLRGPLGTSTTLVVNRATVNNLAPEVKQVVLQRGLTHFFTTPQPLASSVPPPSAEPCYLALASDPTKVIGCYNYLVYLVPRQSPAAMKFRLVPGLLGPDYVSIQAVDQPDHYLRHQNDQFKLHPLPQNDRLFQWDASFTLLHTAAGGVVFQLANYPDRDMTVTRDTSIYNAALPDWDKCMFVIVKP